MSDGVLGMVVGSLQRLEDSLGRLSADMRVELSKLPEQYVHRREADRRFDELCLDLGAEQAARKADIAELKAAAAAAEQSRVTARRWLIGLAVATSMSGVGVFSGVVLRFT